MTRLTLITALLLMTGIQVAKSQQGGGLRNPKLGIGLEAAIGDTKIGTGYSLNFQSPITRNLNWTATVGKTNLSSTLKVMPKPKYENWVTKVGVKYFLTEQFYVAGDLGAAFDQIQRKTTRFAWSPGLGAELNIFGESALDVALKYEAYQSGNPLRFFALKVALNLGL